MSKFLLIEKKDEILELLKNAPTHNRGEIWQTLPDLRHHYKIMNIRDDDLNKAIVFETSEDFLFNPKLPVYVRINHRDLIFKLSARSFVISGNKLACSYPTMAKAVDKRGVVRIPLPESRRDTTAVLKPLGPSTELRVRLIDISKTGLGIAISDMNREYLLRNERFKLTMINDVKLTGDHQMDLKYVERLGRGFIKSGLNLRKPFADDIFDMICKVIFGNSKLD